MFVPGNWRGVQPQTRGHAIGLATMTFFIFYLAVAIWRDGGIMIQ
jgi:hypothetical protein